MAQSVQYGPLASMAAPQRHAMPKIAWYSFQNPWVQLVLAAATVTLVILSTTLEGYADRTMRNLPSAPYWSLWIWPSIWWYGWALLTPFILGYIARYPLTRAQWKEHLPYVGVGGIVFYSIHVTIQVAAMYLPRYRDVHPDLYDAIAHHGITTLIPATLLYLGLVGLVHGISSFQAIRKRQIRAAQLESELAKAQVHALKMQLQPHFLFNTLNGISTLMHRDVQLADATLARLSELLRYTLDRSEEQEIPLGEELAFIEKYLQIEQTRLGDRLTTHFDIPSSLHGVLVPTLLLQPLVENAIRHGIAPRSAPGTVTIRAEAVSKQLKLTIEDNGIGLPKTPFQTTSGIGLGNTQARLAHLYGKDQSVALYPVQPHGLMVIVTLPLRFAE